MSQSSISSVLAQVDEIIISTVNEQSLVGLGVGIVHRGEVIYARGFGFANVEQGRVVTLDTIFHIASVSKTLTAIVWGV